MFEEEDGKRKRPTVGDGVMVGGSSKAHRYDAGTVPVAGGADEVTTPTGDPRRNHTETTWDGAHQQPTVVDDGTPSTHAPEPPLAASHQQQEEEDEQQEEGQPESDTGRLEGTGAVSPKPDDDDPPTAATVDAGSSQCQALGADTDSSDTGVGDDMDVEPQGPVHLHMAGGTATVEEATPDPEIPAALGDSPQPAASTADLSTGHAAVDHSAVTAEISDSPYTDCEESGVNAWELQARKHPSLLRSESSPPSLATDGALTEGSTAEFSRQRQRSSQSVAASAKAGLPPLPPSRSRNNSADQGGAPPPTAAALHPAAPAPARPQHAASVGSAPAGTSFASQNASLPQQQQQLPSTRRSSNASSPPLSASLSPTPASAGGGGVAPQTTAPPTHPLSNFGGEGQGGDHEIVEKSPGGRYVRFVEKLGSGAYKDVYRAYDTIEGIEVAWNVVTLTGVPKLERGRIVNEVRLLERLHHHNIISFHGSWVNREKEQVIFVTEILSSGTLKSFINKVQVIRWKIAKRWAIQILKGLEYLHSQDPPIIHRDLKCDNIFINGTSGDLRIGDLGLSTVISNKSKVLSVLGTPEFMAPELYDEVYDEKVDIYAFGMCLLEIFTKEIPYRECSNPAQIYKKVTHGIPPESLRRVRSQEAREFIMFCLGTEPGKEGQIRPSASELLRHPFLAKKVDDDSVVEVDPPMHETSIAEVSGSLSREKVGDESGVSSTFSTSTRAASDGDLAGDTLVPGQKNNDQPDVARHPLSPAPPEQRLNAIRISGDDESERQQQQHDRQSDNDSDDDGSDHFGGMPDREVNMKKVKVLMGRGQVIEDDDDDRPPLPVDTSTTTMAQAKGSETISQGETSQRPSPAKSANVANRVTRSESESSGGSAGGQNRAPESQYLVAAVAIEEEGEGEKPYKDDMLKLMITLPVEGETQNVQFNFHLVEDDPVQVAREMVEELQVPEHALLEISATISGLARSARMKQDRYNQQQKLAHSQVLQQQGMVMHQQQPQQHFHQQQQQLTPLVNPDQHLSAYGTPAYGTSAAGPGGQVYHPPPQGQPHQVHSGQSLQQPYTGGQVVYSTVSQQQLGASGGTALHSLPGNAVSGEGYTVVIHQGAMMQPPGGGSSEVPSPPMSQASAGTVPQHQQQHQQQYPSALSASAPAARIAHDKRAHPSSQVVKTVAQETVKIRGVKEDKGALRKTSSAEDVPVQISATGAPRCDQKVNLSASNVAASQTQTLHSAGVPEGAQENANHSTDTSISDAESEDSNAEELRQLEEDFQKNLQRAKKAYDTRMDNLQRSKIEKEAQHLKTLEKHEKERAEFERRVKQAEMEQNRRLEQLEKQWAQQRETLAKTKPGRDRPRQPASNGQHAESFSPLPPMMMQQNAQSRTHSRSVSNLEDSSSHFATAAISSAHSADSDLPKGERQRSTSQTRLPSMDTST